MGQPATTHASNVSPLHVMSLADNEHSACDPPQPPLAPAAAAARRTSVTARTAPVANSRDRCTFVKADSGQRSRVQPRHASALRSPQGDAEHHADVGIQRRPPAAAVRCNTLFGGGSNSAVMTNA
jgi:hypothetical protein